MDWSRFRGLGDFLKGRRKVSLEDFRRVNEVAREVNDWLRSILPIGPEVVDLMTYPDAIRYFVDSRPRDSQVVKGAMLLQPHPQGHMLVQVFLDRENDLACDASGKPYGRRLVVRELDAELGDTFGDKDLVILE